MVFIIMSVLFVDISDKISTQIFISALCGCVVQRRKTLTECCQFISTELHTLDLFFRLLMKSVYQRVVICMKGIFFCKEVRLEFDPDVKLWRNVLITHVWSK